MITCTRSRSTFCFTITVLHLIKWFVELHFNILLVHVFLNSQWCFSFRDCHITRQQQHLARVIVTKVLRLVWVKNKRVHRGVEAGERTNGNTRAGGEVCVGGSQISRSSTSWTFVHTVSQGTWLRRWKTGAAQDGETTCWTNWFGHISWLSWCMQVFMLESETFGGNLVLKLSHFPLL